MRIFVSGATGVIGRRVVPMLLAQGHSVTAVAPNPPSPAEKEKVGATFVPVDLFDVDEIKHAMAGHDAIINLATHMPSTAWQMLSRTAWRMNDRLRREGVANVVEAALYCGIGTLVQESFALTYPDRGDHWIDERTALDPPDAYYVTMNGMFHINWTDAPLWSPIVRWIGLAGPIDPYRGFAVTNAYTLAFFDRYLKGKPSPLLDETSGSEPDARVEVRRVSTSN